MRSNPTPPGHAPTSGVGGVLFLVAFLVAGCIGSGARTSPTTAVVIPSVDATATSAATAGPTAAPTITPAATPSASPISAASPTPTPPYVHLVGPGPSVTPARSATPRPVPSGTVAPLPPGPDPDLVAMFPTEVDGYQVVTTSGKATDMPESQGCIAVCLDQLRIFATEAGGTVETMTLAMGFPLTGRTTIYDWGMYAIRAPGADPSKLIDAWRKANATGREEGSTPHEATIGGKTVTVAMSTSIAARPGGWQFIYTDGEIVFAMVVPRYDPIFETPPTEIPSFVVEALQKLP